jgi:histidinol-phosphate aminotransferase
VTTEGRKPLPISPRIAALAGYVPGEQPTDPRIVKLNTNENPYPPSPRVAEAIGAEAQRLNRYPSPMADALRAAAADLYGVAPEQVLAGNGSDELLMICVRACASEGDAIAYATPTYSLYRTLAAVAGARSVEIPFADIAPATALPLPRELFDADAALVFVCNPNSPLGAPVALGEVSALCSRTRGLVVSDEAYVDFGGASALELLGRHRNLVVLRTLSKSFSLAGLRLGLAFGDAAVIAELAKVKDSYNVSRLAIAAGTAAIRDHAWMRANVARVVATRERVVAALGARGFGVVPSAANFFWMDCGAEGGRAVYERLRSRGVLVRFFDEDRLRGGVRISVGTDEEMDRLLAALDER